MDNKRFEKYLDFIQKVDNRVEELEKQHQNNMNCKKGCDSCCMHFSILPVEFEFIKESIKNIEIEKPKWYSRKCVFLKNGVCQIYTFRPYICRSHGVPMIYMNQFGTDWQLGHCKLNFKTIDKKSLSLDNCFEQDRFNSELFLINKEFVKNNSLEYGEMEMVAIKKLLK